MMDFHFCQAFEMCNSDAGLTLRLKTKMWKWSYNKFISVNQVLNNVAVEGVFAFALTNECQYILTFCAPRAGNNYLYMT